MKLSIPAILLLACLASGAAQAQNALIDYQGYAWEDGGFPPSNAGDSLFVVGVVDGIDSRFGVNFATEEVTLWVRNLVSGGQVSQGGSLISVAYSSGDIDLYRDPSKNRDYGINPRNGTVPSTFTNGSLFLGGTLTSFFLNYDTSTDSGAYEGTVAFSSGSGLVALGQLNANGFTFGGLISRPVSGGTVPQGYDLQCDGTIAVEVRVGVENKSWGAVKEMYRP
jgi:hypothetical protein